MKAEHETDPVAAWLRRVAATDEPPTSLPTAGRIWWKAQILRRLEKEDERARRAARPAEWCRRLVGAVVLAAVVSILSLTLGQGADQLTQVLASASTILASAGLVLPLAAGIVALTVLWRDG